jgi:hypothetical protein
MNVLFDDGSTIDRRLRFEDRSPDFVIGYLGRYGPYSEAFQYFRFVDNIWGDFMSRDFEEIRYAREQLGEEGEDLDENHPKFKAPKVKFKEKYYLKRIINIELLNDPTDITWQSLNTEVADIAALFPPKEGVFDNDLVVGVAFSIYRREAFNPLGQYNRKKTSDYYLDIRLVVNDVMDIDKANYPTTFKENKIVSIKVSEIINEKWNPRKDLLPPENDSENLYRVGPILVLNKETIRNNRNYTGGPWNEPTDWEKMIVENPNNWEINKGKEEIVFLPHKYWEFEENHPPAPKMVVRIGLEGARHILFLHGDQEAGCPIRIPRDE